MLLQRFFAPFISLVVLSSFSSQSEEKRAHSKIACVSLFLSTSSNHDDDFDDESKKTGIPSSGGEKATTTRRQRRRRRRRTVGFRFVLFGVQLFAIERVRRRGAENDERDEATVESTRPGTQHRDTTEDDEEEDEQNKDEEIGADVERVDDDDDDDDDDQRGERRRARKRRRSSPPESETFAKRRARVLIAQNERAKTNEERERTDEDDFSTVRGGFWERGTRWFE